MSLPCKNQAAREEAYTQSVTHTHTHVSLCKTHIQRPVVYLCWCLFTWLLCVRSDVGHRRVTRWFTVVEKYMSLWKCSSDAASCCHMCSKLSR